MFKSCILFHLFQIFDFQEENYLLAQVKVFPPSQKCFPPVQKGKYLPARESGGDRKVAVPPPPTTLWHATPSYQSAMVLVVYGGSLLGTNNPYNRSSGPPCRLLYFCTTHSIICHSESYWGLIEGNPLYNQTSRLLIDRLFFIHSSSGSESSRIVLKPKKSFCAAIFPAARFMSHLWLGWPLVIRSALETTISRWPPPSAINNCDWSPLQLTMIRALTVTHTLVQDEPRQTNHETDIILSGYHISQIDKHLRQAA